MTNAPIVTNDIDANGDADPAVQLQFVFVCDEGSSVPHLGKSGDFQGLSEIGPQGWELPSPRKVKLRGVETLLPPLAVAAQRWSH